jgi:ABC-type branched-subunit amino acid transport system permease subunit
MTVRDGFWFVAGLLCALAVVLLALPLLRTRAAAQLIAPLAWRLPFERVWRDLNPIGA